MNLNKTWMAAILLVGGALGAACSNLNAQTWQPKWQSADGSTASTDWDQRVLKQSQPVQQTSVQRSVDAYQPAGSYRMAQRSSFDRNPMGTVSMESEPAMPMNQPNQRKPIAGAEIIEPGMTQFEPMGQEGPMAGNCPECGNPCGTCGACNDCCDFGWEVFDGRCGPLLRGLSIFAGADAFKGPLDRGTNGNFGLNEGLNLARPLGDPWGCGYQLGVNFVQSDFSGARTLRSTTIAFGLRSDANTSPRPRFSIGPCAAGSSGAWPMISCKTISIRRPTYSRFAAKPAMSLMTRTRSATTGPTAWEPTA